MCFKKPVYLIVFESLFDAFVKISLVIKKSWFLSVKYIN